MVSHMDHRHSSHPDIVNRLKRVDGHLRRIIAMIEDGRPCVDIAQQLQAVEKAITQAKKTLIHDHLEHCIGDAAEAASGSGRASITELRDIARYL